MVTWSQSEWAQQCAWHTTVHWSIVIPLVLRVSSCSSCVRWTLQSLACLHQQRCQVFHFWWETPVFGRLLWPPVWQYISAVFTFYQWHIWRWLPHTRWWSRCRCLAARPPSAPLFTYLRSSHANSWCTRHCTIVNMTKWSDKSEKIRNYAKVQRWLL